MDYQELEIKGVFLLRPKYHEDERGYFAQTYSRAVLDKIGIGVELVQDNQSFSQKKATVRGLHFQLPPMDQDKLVRVTSGAVLDVVVDIRRNSPTFGKHVSVVLSAKNRAQLWLPKGMAHGFCTMEPDTQFLYKVSNYYSPEHERGILWNDSALGIDWPASEKEAILLDKDKNLPTLAQAQNLFE